MTMERSESLWGGDAGPGDGEEINPLVFPKPPRWITRPPPSGAERTRTLSTPPTAGASTWPGRETPATPLLPDGPPGNPRCSAAGQRWYRPIPQRWNRLKRKGTPALRRPAHLFPECVGSPWGSDSLAWSYLYDCRSGFKKHAMHQLCIRCQALTERCKLGGDSHRLILYAGFGKTSGQYAAQWGTACRFPTQYPISGIG